MTQEKTRYSDGVQEDLGKKCDLILFNDDVNTFEYVINTLIEVCHHDPITAEQCTMIAHYKGKCAVKSGDYDQLLPYAQEMLRRGLTVEISS